MKVAKLSYEGREDRYVELSNGTHVFGADFECDVVLIDEGVLPRHFSVEVEDQLVTLNLFEGADADLVTGSKNATALVAGQETPWSAKEHLKIGGLRIELSGLLGNSLPAEKADVTPQRRSFVQQFARKAAMLAGLSILGWVGAGVVAKELADPLPTPDSEMSSRVEISTPTLDVETLNSLLNDNGFVADEIVKTGRGFAATFHVASVSDRNRLDRVLSTFDVPVEARIHLDSALLGAANMVIEASGKSAGQRNVENGVLFIEDFEADEDERRKLKTLLHADVPGLKSIKFVGADRSWAKDLDEKIKGIWIGERPYLMLAAGKKVYPGQMLAPGIYFVRANSRNSITVKINEATEEYKLP